MAPLWMFGIIIFFGALAPDANAALVQITHRNAPLGMTWREVRTRFPSCKLDKSAPIPYDYIIPDLAPLEYYDPPLSVLIPQDVHESGLDQHLIQTTDLECPPLYNVDESFTMIFYSGKVLAIIKSSTNKAYHYARLIQILADSLPGRHGRIHAAIEPGSGSEAPTPVLVTYVDNGDQRIVIETWKRTPTSLNPFPDTTLYAVAYVDLPLWQDYMVASKVDMNRRSINARRDARKKEKKQRQRLENSM